MAIANEALQIRAQKVLHQVVLEACEEAGRAVTPQEDLDIQKSALTFSAIWVQNISMVLD